MKAKYMTLSACSHVHLQELSTWQQKPSKVGTGHDDFRPHHQRCIRHTNTSTPFLLVQILIRMLKGTADYSKTSSMIWWVGDDLSDWRNYHEGSTRPILYEQRNSPDNGNRDWICYEQLTADQRHCRFQQASHTSALYIWQWRDAMM